jgi:hypothetical protein
MQFSKITIRSAELKIGQNVVHEPIVHYEGRYVRCNDRLRGDLSRLVPSAWGRAKESDWRPFVERAAVVGAL